MMGENVDNFTKSDPLVQAVNDMSSTSLHPRDIDQEQHLLLPKHYTWQEFEALEQLLETAPGLRITYLDGWIELRSISEAQEQIKFLMGMFLEAYFVAMGIEFIPVGNATRRGEPQGTSFEPDESYYLGEKKSHPDLAIEVILTSGNLQKLEKYRRFGIQEVWFWENNQIAIYHLQANQYQASRCSQLLPDLDLELLARCVLMPSRLAAMQAWTQGIARG